MRTCNYISTMIVMLLAFFLSACHKDAKMAPQDPVVTENELEVWSTAASFTWTVDYPGALYSVVKLSLKDDMSDATNYGRTDLHTATEKDFSTVASGLIANTKYYYCYEVFHPLLSYSSEVKSFTTNSLSDMAGATGGLFSVSEKRKALFSQGNLQYQASTNTWRFAEHQYDMIGADNSNISSSYSGWIDLFGWGTSGYNHGANCYQPWSTSDDSGDYYAYGSYTYSLYDQTGQADWGYNPINNGGNHTGLWHTMTKDQWDYLFHTRNTSSGVRYAKAIVNDKNGVILLPDDWKPSTFFLFRVNEADAPFNTNVITTSQWNIIEQAGAVFLPAAGERGGSIVYDELGCYWTSTNAPYSGDDYYIRIGDSFLDRQNAGSYIGMSVRLVMLTTQPRHD